MPRLNTFTYIAQHYQLKQFWVVDQRLFSYLTQSDQLDMHKFYLFGLDKTDRELSDHRIAVQFGDPSLPQRAGKAFAKLLRGDRQTVRGIGMTNGRQISIRPLMRPTPDLHLLSKALLLLAEQEAGEQDNDKAA